ncbi:MAG TPA: hypothetical protein VGS19_00415 [Streptosporangiaceae bacterium]|nr:hypothetical protein [Streptosporangiaceae bacterium]
MVQPAPPPSDQPAAPPAPPIPATLAWAVRLMYAGAVVSVIEVVYVLTQGSAIRSALSQQFPTYTASQIHTLEITRMDGSVVGGLIGAGLWVLMARVNLAGKAWARIAAAVLFGLASLSLGLNFGGRVLVGLLVLVIITWLVGLATVILLWLKPTREYQDAVTDR